MDFTRYNTKCRGENETLRGIFRVISRFLLHFVLYHGNSDYFFGPFVAPPPLPKPYMLQEACPEDLCSLDNDSFLNSLEAVTAEYWVDANNKGTHKL